MIELLYIAAIILGYLVMGWWSIWYDFKRPVFMPFWLFRTLCAFGKKKPLDNLPKGMDGLDKMEFLDPLYREWFGQVIKSGCVTKSQFFCFQQQRAHEIDCELRRRGNK